MDDKMEKKFVICGGNVSDGFDFYGLFTDPATAVEWADKEITSNWSLIVLSDPYDYTENS
jgi:hypothetical protein